MGAWQLIPWMLQYMIGGILSLAISMYLVNKSKGIKTYWIFFAFGLSAALWLFFVFFHRTAATPELSKLFFRFGMFFTTLVHPCLLLLMLYLWKERPIWVLSILPALGVALIAAMSAPFDIMWATPALGWSYRFKPYFGRFYFWFQIGYMIAILFAGAFLVQKARTKILRRKYIVIISSYIIFYCAGMGITQTILQSHPAFPPIAGILLTLEFLSITYALTLPTERIVPSKLLDKLANTYLNFLKTFQDKIPGRELGESSFRFNEYLEAMGLKNTIVPKSGELIFEIDKFRDVDISELPDSILKIIKEHSWAIETVNDFTDVLIKTYETLQLKSKDAADEWLEKMLQRHGAFLADQSVLAAMPKELKIPEIFKELQLGRAYLFKEEKPAQAYKKLKEALNYGFVCLCISKLHPQKVRERYDIEKASIFWLTFKKAEGTINPKDLVKLDRMISEFVKRPDESLILLDCFDQIKFANGFQKSLTVLKNFRNLRNENKLIVLISVNPEMFEKREFAAIEKELEEVRTE